MKVRGVHYRTIWGNGDGSVGIIDQTRLPHAFETLTLITLADAARAIKIMQVRGAPLIGVTAAYGVALALKADASDAGLESACASLAATRPTAVNLNWALREMQKSLGRIPPSERAAAAYAKAAQMADEDVETCRLIGHHGRNDSQSHIAAGFVTELVVWTPSSP